MHNQLLLLWPNYGDELPHSECVTNCYYLDQINGAELSHSECTTNNCYYFDQMMVTNCHTENVETIVIILTKLMVTNCHTQNTQPIVITSTKLWSWTVILRMRKQLLLLSLNYGDKLSHSECATNCYYIDQINGALWTVTLRMHNQLFLLWPNKWWRTDVILRMPNLEGKYEM